MDEELQTDNPLSGTGNMEVHHHPEVEKKGLKEYLLEGLMIFVAVTMGFFAEGLRENINNGEKETEYIHSLTGNLQQDTSDLNYSIRFNLLKLKGLDSLLSLSSRNMTEPANRQLLYQLAPYISLYSRFNSNDATMLQLKNAGGLQYIKHNHIADSIAKYDQEVRAIYAAEDPYAKTINDAMDASAEVLILRPPTDSMYVQHNAGINDRFLLLTNDQQKIAIFFNKIYQSRGWTKNYINNLAGRLPYTKRLIQLLKKEYDLD